MAFSKVSPYFHITFSLITTRQYIYTMPEVPISFYYFGYVPNSIINAVALGVFSLLFLILVFRVFFSATSPKFLLFLPLTAAIEISGLAIRYVCITAPTSDLFTAMSVLLLLSANILVLVNYKAVGEVIRLSGVETRYRVLGPQFTKFFYKTNIVSSILTGVGSGISTSSDTKTIGSALTIVGIVLQLIFFAVFVVATRYIDTCPDYQYQANGIYNPKSKLMRIMYITMALIIIRCIYRLVNYIIIMIHPGVHEWTFYVFDVLIIAICFLVHCIWHTGNFLPSVQEQNTQKPGNEHAMDNVNSSLTMDHRGYNNV